MRHSNLNSTVNVLDSFGFGGLYSVVKFIAIDLLRSCFTPQLRLARAYRQPAQTQRQGWQAEPFTALGGRTTFRRVTAMPAMNAGRPWPVIG